MNRLLFLVGYMGCGKSTLGRKLARRLGVAFVDTDTQVEEREGASVADVFRYEGETRFREVERAVLDATIARYEAAVVSTGGGLPTWGDNMERMNGAGCTVYLRRTAAQIAARLSPYGRQKRPRLRGLSDDELVAFMERDMAAREPFYGRATVVVSCDGLTDDEIMEYILAHADDRCGGAAAEGNNAPIGVYDSGLGGLTVWREIRRLLPDESLVYLGDGKNCPYGSRPREEVQALADAAVSRLVGEGCKMVVVACNTATAAAIDFLRAKYPGVPIVGMEPAVKPACLHTRSGVVGVLATERSLDGELFRRTAAKYGEGIEVLTVPGRGFVELVESDREATPEAEACVREAVAPMLARGADQIVLGCTHYPFLLPVLERVVAGRGVTIVDPSPAVARRVAQLLDGGSLRAAPGHRAELRFETFADEAYRRRLETKALTEP